MYLWIFFLQNKSISDKALTDLESEYISKFKFDTLYNFKAIATSMLGYNTLKMQEKRW